MTSPPTTPTLTHWRGTPHPPALPCPHPPSTPQLVFSDEFEADGRSFGAAGDPRWTAGAFWYGSTQDLEVYRPEQVWYRCKCGTAYMSVVPL